MSGADQAAVADAALAEMVRRPRSSSIPASFTGRMPSQMFAVPRDATGVRRLTDVVQLVFALGLLLW
jgi:hypothetical protein